MKTIPSIIHPYHVAKKTRRINPHRTIQNKKNQKSIQKIQNQKLRLSIRVLQIHRNPTTKYSSNIKHNSPIRRVQKPKLSQQYKPP